MKLKQSNRSIYAPGPAAAVLAAALLTGCQSASAPYSAATVPPEDAPTAASAATAPLESGPAAASAASALEPLARCVQVNGVLY